MFGWLFGGSKKADKVVDTGCNLLESAASGIDKVFFTEEERSDAAQKAFQLWVESQAAFADENSIRAVTRRVLAVSFCIVYLFLLLASVILYRFDPGWGDTCFSASKVLSSVVLTIVIFYFGPNMIGRAVKQARGK